MTHLAALRSKKSLRDAFASYFKNKNQTLVKFNFEAISVSVGDVIVQVDERYVRTTEVESLLGDPSTAKLELGWEPKISVRKVCSKMVRCDYLEASKSFLRTN